MTHWLDCIVDRRHSDSRKWRQYGEDMLPLWIADMDFPAPEPVLRALHERVAHGIFGYGLEPPELRPLLVERLEHLYGWSVSPEALVFIPGVMSGFNLAARTVASPGDGMLVQTPIYYPILRIPTNVNLVLEGMELTRQADGRYEIDFDLMAATFTSRTRLFLLCNPHNPVGRVFRRDELERMAELCLRHDVFICSDEIHCDLVFPGHRHVPIASLAPEIADRTITLMAPSKTYNLAGLHCAFAIIPNAELRRRFQLVRADLVPGVDVLGFTAALAAYRHGEPWLKEVLAYLEANRDFLWTRGRDYLPGVGLTQPEGTYLAWLDCRSLADGPTWNPHRFFLERARVILNDGAVFGQGGEGFVRLNFACPRATLREALERMRQAIEAGAGVSPAQHGEG